VYVLDLDARSCICCGICSDSCPTGALAMPTDRQGFDTFPYLADAGACDGCGVCERECPLSALAIR